MQKQNNNNNVDIYIYIYLYTYIYTYIYIYIYIYMYVCNAMLSHIPCLFSSFLRCSASFLFHLIVNFFFFFSSLGTV